ncbi:uncharacterized protein LTR77_007435 [Saxophila tyrrhenica]|uniref:Protein kinase domain-containing protein n=1 Tax=Saxophila tyrrhenica TaxID=1690608 RepID=A0AAV9P6M7_9PEZI|nr:hypothetical protein LTR77_007435 [Saxophila tyrrhenica]
MRGIREIAGGQIPPDILRPMLYGLLLDLEFLHSDAHIVYIEIQEGNVMLSITDPTILDEVLEAEAEDLQPSKVDGDPIIYPSVDIDMPDDPGQPVICDFGDAKVGTGPFEGEVMPDLYRAAEILLKIAWDSKTDIWAFGLMTWDLLEGKHLFNERLPSREESSEAHLVRMVSLLGPPPKDLLERSSVPEKFFDNEGKLKAGGKIGTALEDGKVFWKGRRSPNT